VRITAIVTAVALVVAAEGFAQAGPGPEGSFFSGYEVFPGLSFNGFTFGASFAGWTNGYQTPDSSGGETCPATATDNLDNFGDWAPLIGSTGGVVSGSVNYKGTPGFGNTVNVIGGSWYWLEADNKTSHSGLVLKGGTVSWPASLEDFVGDNDCGCGVAEFTVTISLGRSQTEAGTISGCLNDKNPDVFPPKIWGQLTLMSAP
jgi:hypothetical protein